MKYARTAAAVSTLIASMMLAACGSDSDPDSATSDSTDPAQNPSDSSTTDSSTADSTSAEPAEPTTLTAADFEALAICALLPETTPGPFPTQDKLTRRDITEG